LWAYEVGDETVVIAVEPGKGGPPGPSLPVAQPVIDSIDFR
jgi:hypothetical protein